jgi:hypothetical protein
MKEHAAIEIEWKGESGSYLAEISEEGGVTLRLPGASYGVEPDAALRDLLLSLAVEGLGSCDDCEDCTCEEPQYDA